MSRAKRILVAHPSPDLYGSDRQLLVTLDALLAEGWQAKVILPESGPLVELLRQRGILVGIEDFPVLRKELLSPKGLAKLAATGPAVLMRLSRLIRVHDPTIVLVNTLTIPAWLAAAKAARKPVVNHVHEADSQSNPLLRYGLVGPLLLSSRVVANSQATKTALVGAVGALDSRISVVHNGVPAPSAAPSPLRSRVKGDSLAVAVIGRLSARKGVDVAVRAVRALAREGRAVTLAIAGTAFRGYEEFVRELEELAAGVPEPGEVRFLGYVDPPWELLSETDVLVMPSMGESFGNVAVEGQLANRPVIATGVQGLLEIVDDGQTGLTVPPGDVPALAAAIARLADDPDLARRLADAGHSKATAEFSTERYGARMVQIMNEVARR